MASVGASLGLSGLPLNDMLAKLRTVEEAPLTTLANRKKGLETQITAYGTLSNSLTSLQTAIKALAKTDTFGTFKTTSSLPETLSATVKPNAGAVGGHYQIAVEELATSQSLAVAGQTSRTDALGSGEATITFTLGDGSTKIVKVADGNTSLEGIRKAINEADIGVSATLINSGDASNPHVLTMSSLKTGTDARVTGIQVSGNSDVADLLAYDEATSGVDPTQVTQRLEAKDAKLLVNGISVVSGSNTIEGAIEGVTLSVKAKTPPGAPLTLQVSPDDDATIAAIDAFVLAYNALNSTVTRLTSADTEAGTKSALTGDRVPRNIQTRLQRAVGDAIDNGGFATLAQIGITTNPKTGKLDVDSTKLAKALRETPDDVRNLFTGDDGLAKRVDTTITQLMDSKGLIANARTGLQETVKDLDKQTDRMTLRIEDTMARYRAQFVALEKFVTQMQGTGDYLTQQLANLGTK